VIETIRQQPAEDGFKVSISKLRLWVRLINVVNDRPVIRVRRCAMGRGYGQSKSGIVTKRKGHSKGISSWNLEAIVNLLTIRRSQANPMVN
jgi:hypothetical protein